MLDLRLRTPPMLITLGSGAAMWALARSTPGLTVDFAGRWIVALAVAAAGILLTSTGGAAFFRARTTVMPTHPERASHLVTSGVYRFTRNPMYLGMLLLLAGWAVELGSAPALLVIPGYVAYLNWSQIRPEEAALQQRFGAQFAAYRSRVRRWI